MNRMIRTLATRWLGTKDGRTWEFVLGKGPRFEDVTFSFERYQGAAAPLFKERVREVQVVDPGRVRFQRSIMKRRGVFVGATGAAGNASTRIEPYATGKGVNSYASWPTAPIPSFPYSAPQEDVRLKR